MPETTNISQMAEMLSRDIFGVFGWNHSGSMNVNWSCTKPALHKVKTHPCDAVWYYDEPYADYRTYIQADLKSYAKNTITKDTIIKAIESLSLALDCTETSDEWQQSYIVNSNIPSRVDGLLFVYNHDGEYDKEFSEILKSVMPSDIRNIPKNRRLAVLGPKDICELNTICNHIKQLGYSPSQHKAVDTAFFYPEIKRKKYNPRGENWQNSATLDLLYSDIIPLKVRRGDSANGYDELHIYYRGKGDCPDEFLHLIDYLFRYQQIVTAKQIHIHLVSLEVNGTASSAFLRAKNEYMEATKLTSGKLEPIHFDIMQNVIRSFNQTEIGIQGRI